MVAAVYLSVAAVVIGTGAAAGGCWLELVLVVVGGYGGGDSGSDG